MERSLPADDAWGLLRRGNGWLLSNSRYIIRLVATLTSLVIALALSTEVRAGTLPDISGTWYANGNPAAPCHISQSGNSVSLSNERGVTATGNLVDPSTLSTNWGLLNGGQISGTISSDLRRISWSNGTYWSRPNAAPLVPSSTPKPSPRPTPVPLRVSVMPIAYNHSNPIYVYAASLTNGYQPFTAQQCVSYRNVSTKAASVVAFHFIIKNRSGGVEQEFGWSDRGSFTPPVNIENHCVSRTLPPPGVVRAMADESIALTQITFADGTSWKPGMSFTRGYAVSGERLPQPVVQTTQSTNALASNDLFAHELFHLSTQFTGSGKCLDVINGGRKDRLTMATCGDYSGQKWWAQQTSQGRVRLKNTFTGSGKCLDVVNDGTNNRVIMATCGDYSGQMWWAEESANGFLRLRNAFTGWAKCLDILNDGRNDQLRLADCGNYSGQRWILGARH